MMSPFNPGIATRFTVGALAIVSFAACRSSPIASAGAEEVRQVRQRVEIGDFGSPDSMPPELKAVSDTFAKCFMSGDVAGLRALAERPEGNPGLEEEIQESIAEGRVIEISQPIAVLMSDWHGLPHALVFYELRVARSGILVDAGVTHARFAFFAGRGWRYLDRLNHILD